MNKVKVQCHRMLPKLNCTNFVDELKYGGEGFFFFLAYPSSNSIVMEVHKCLGDFLLVSTISVQLSRVQEVLRKCDPIRDVVATRTPLPSLYRDETVSRRIATTLAAEVAIGAG